MTKHKDEKSKSKPEVTRQQFLGVAWGGSLLALFGQGAAALMSYLQPVSTGGFGGRVYAGRVDEFSVGSVSRVLTGRFYLVRTEEGFLALWQKCTHLGCSVPWAENEDQFHCPCHGSVFNKMGEVTGGPAPRPMDVFPVEIVDGEVYVDTSKPLERSSFDISQITRV